jgi:hypothetical protein
MSRSALLLFVALAACEEDSPLADTGWLHARTWDDGKAVVSVYRGRFLRYGIWRDAEVRDYLVREFLDPMELTKRDRPVPGSIPVIKANRQLTFDTGTYGYRFMHSLFFHRETGHLVKAVAASQEGCGIVFLRWDARDRRLRFDSYWEGEGAGGIDLPKPPRSFFADEIAFLGAMLEDGARITSYPALLRNRAGAPAPASADPEECRDCAPSGTLVGAPSGESLTVARDGRICRLKDAAGKVVAEYAYDADGFLERWEIPGTQEFRRVSRARLYYWEFTKPGDERRLQGE